MYANVEEENQKDIYQPIDKLITSEIKKEKVILIYFSSQ